MKINNSKAIADKSVKGTQREESGMFHWRGKYLNWTEAWEWVGVYQADKRGKGEKQEGR